MTWNATLDNTLATGFINTGTKPCDAVITITTLESYYNLTLYLVETGQYLKIENSGDEGDVIEINMQARQILCNSENIENKLTLTSQWFLLPVGQCLLDLVGAAAGVKVEYRRRWV